MSPVGLVTSPLHPLQGTVGGLKAGHSQAVEASGLQPLCRLLGEFSIPHSQAWFQRLQPHGPHRHVPRARAEQREPAWSSLSRVWGFCLLVYSCRIQGSPENRQYGNSKTQLGPREINELRVRSRHYSKVPTTAGSCYKNKWEKIGFFKNTFINYFRCSLFFLEDLRFHLASFLLSLKNTFYSIYGSKGLLASIILAYFKRISTLILFWRLYLKHIKF